MPEAGPVRAEQKGRQMEEASSGVARRISGRWFLALLSAFLLLSYGPIRFGLVAIDDAWSNGASAQGTDNSRGQDDNNSKKSGSSKPGGTNQNSKQDEN